jgi:cytochrome c peroxidase
MKQWLFFMLLVGLGYFLSCKSETATTLDEQLEHAVDNASPTGSYKHYIMPSGSDYNELPNQDVKNPINTFKVALGKMLFFETGIGLKPNNSVSLQAYSCSSCHFPSKGFTAGRFQGIADGAIGFGGNGEGRFKNPLYTGDQVDAQGARPLPTINLTYITNALWAGSFGSFGVNVGTESVWHNDTLTEINFKGLQGLEANNFRALVVHRQVINKAVTDSLGYTALFDLAFPDIPVSDRYSQLTASFAISAYQRTILTNEAPFQLWLKGDKSALSDLQKQGALLFFGKAGCHNCHSSPSLNNMAFASLGVNNLYQSGYEVYRTGPADKRNLGRGGFTTREEDMHKFKIPQLYNLRDVRFYFHGASKTTLLDVVEYINRGIPENPDVPASQIAPNFKPLGLSFDEENALTEFLENGLFDPNLNRYRPDKTLSGHCFPDNDLQARMDMGCN